MRFLIAFLFLMIASPATAMEWWSEDGMNHLETADGGMLYQQHDMPEPMLCRVKDWPVNGPISHYDCEDGRQLTIEVFTVEVITLNGSVMTSTRPW